LRRQLPPLAGADFAARVMQAIEQEAVPVAADRRHHHWLRWSAGGAIAASVAVAALMVTQPTGDTGRNATTALTAQSQTRAVARTVPASQPATPAAVPPWLSGNSAGLLSQQASATLGAPFDVNQPVYTRRLSAYPSLPRFRTLDNKDGSYLLLLDPAQQATSTNIARQAATGAQ
jgi:sigma-E factor negative regulatory protein RseA